MELSYILQKLGIEKLTPMQKAMEEACTKNNDVVLLSPTGTGKTLAFLLPLVQSLKTGEKEIQAIVLVPSRELALQISEVLKKMNTPFKTVCCYGGRPAMEEHKLLRELSPSVVVGTPGRVCDHLRKGNINGTNIRTLVIDEFDKCLELGFQDEMAEAIGYFGALKKRILLSATDTDEIPGFVGMGTGGKQQGCSRGIVKLNYLNQNPVTSQRLQFFKVLSAEKDKLETLYRLLCVIGKTPTLVFVNYRESAERVFHYLQSKKVLCNVFHGGMEQIDRERALYKFRNGSCPVLISTDLAARGLDIAGIGNVVHYHLPVNEESFTHRNGRTARWDATGAVYLILHAEEQLPVYVTDETAVFEWPEKLPKPFQAHWTTLYIGKGKKDKINKVDIIGFLCKKGGLSKDDIGIVDVGDYYAFAAVRSSKVKQVLMLIHGEKMKGVKVLIEVAQ